MLEIIVVQGFCPLEIQITQFPKIMDSVLKTENTNSEVEFE